MLVLWELRPVPISFVLFSFSSNKIVVGTVYLFCLFLVELGFNSNWYLNFSLYLFVFDAIVTKLVFLQVS